MNVLSSIPTTIRSIRDYAGSSPALILLVAIQIATVLFCSLTTPLFVRHLCWVPFVELKEPLEFTFDTCKDQLHGVCSFPQAEIVFDERNIVFQPGYRYKFKLDLKLTEIELLRASGVFLTQLELKDEKAQTLNVIKKTARVASPGFYGWYIWLRNWFFLPLYVVGLIGNGNLDHVAVEFPPEFRELYDKPSKFLIVQIQNRFIDISSASLRIQANLRYSTYLINNYPVIAYLVMSAISFSIFFSLFAVYWANQGLQLYQQMSSNNIVVTSINNKQHLT